MDSIDSKTCRVCGETKPCDEFQPRKKSKDGLRNDCRQCNNARSRAYYQANTARCRKQSAAWVSQNRDKMRAYYKAYNRERREAIREYNRRYQVENAEALRQYREANRPMRAAAQRRRRARLRNAPGDFTVADASALLVRQRHRCHWCGGSLKPGYEVDHLIALAKGGSNGPENIVLSCAPCNRRKQAQYPWEFREGRLL